jgi:hypothetical protein
LHAKPGECCLKVEWTLTDRLEQLCQEVWLVVVPDQREQNVLWQHPLRVGGEGESLCAPHQSIPVGVRRGFLPFNKRLGRRHVVLDVRDVLGDGGLIQAAGA